MSDVKVMGEKQVAAEVKKLLENQAKVSVEKQNTFYLYSHDKKSAIVLSAFKDGKNATEYAISVEYFNRSAEVDAKSESLCKQLYDIVDTAYNRDEKNKYTFNALSLESGAKKSFGEHDIQDAFQGVDKNKSAKVKQDIITKLIHDMLVSRCPIQMIERMFYYFEQKDEKPVSGEFNKLLDSHTKLVEYKTGRKNIWFFTGVRKASGFLPMSAESQKIFDTVKSVLQKQK